VAEEKTPLQSVTTVLCDALCELPVEDRQRALDIVILTLGIDRPSIQRFDQQSAVLQTLGALFNTLRAEQLAVITPALDQPQVLLLSRLVQAVGLLQQPSTQDPRR
jgi:hypothetical protein